VGHSDRRSAASGHISRHGLSALGNVSIVGVLVAVRDRIKKLEFFLRIFKQLNSESLALRFHDSFLLCRFDVDCF